MFKFESKLDWRRFLMDSIAKGDTWHDGSSIDLDEDSDIFNEFDKEVCKNGIMMVRSDEPLIIANPETNDPEEFELFKAPIINVIEIKDEREFESMPFPKARTWNYYEVLNREVVLGRGISIELDNTKFLTIADLNHELVVKLAREYCYQFGYELKVGGLLTKES